MSVYADTSALMSVLDADDPNNPAAVQVWQRIVGSKETIVTSNYVVVETVSLLHKRFGVPTVDRFRANILPLIYVEWVDEDTHSAGLSALLASSRRGPSLVDCVSFETMRRLDIRNAFAYDKHFADAGFRLI